MRTRQLRRAGAAVAALALIFAACGDDGAGTAADAPTDDSSTTDERRGGEPADDLDSPSDSVGVEDDDDVEGPVETADQVIEVTVTDGDIAGGGRIPVSLGDEVLVRITADVADEVHLHGYDLLVSLEAGVTAELRFDATIPGVFELELHDARLPIAELEIS